MPQRDAGQELLPTRPAPVGPMAGYGARPAAPPAVLALAGRIDEILEAPGRGAAADAIAGLLAGCLRDRGLSALRHLPPDSGHYARHLLYVDPLRRYSMLALVWSPGQGTPVHGHTAWGAVAVLRGELTAVSYRLCKAGASTFRCREHGTVEVRTGQSTTVHPGLDDVHRMTNRARRLAVSLHVYGKDLLADPAGLNIVLDI